MNILREVWFRIGLIYHLVIFLSKISAPFHSRAALPFSLLLILVSGAMFITTRPPASEIIENAPALILPTNDEHSLTSFTPGELAQYRETLETHLLSQPHSLILQKNAFLLEQALGLESTAAARLQTIQEYDPAFSFEKVIPEQVQ